MKLTRRTFFKVTGAAGAAGVATVASATPARAASVAATPGADMRAMLIDTTRCIGCRACEAACSEANAMPAPARAGDAQVFATRRQTDVHALTVVNKYEATAKAPARFIKTQCMHCVEPACASACLARAIEKTPTGPVVYHGNRCLGCRYCMVACPFEIPKFDYESAAPFIHKCTFCGERQAKGLDPACASVCPSGAITFGTRAALIEEARQRIYAPDSKYVRHVYGEHEAGGTSFMYISDRPLDQLGLPDHVPAYAYSALTQGALGAVPFIMTLWPPLLMGLYTFSQRRNAAAHDDPHAGDAPRSEEDRHA